MEEKTRHNFDSFWQSLLTVFQVSDRKKKKARNFKKIALAKLNRFIHREDITDFATLFSGHYIFLLHFLALLKIKTGYICDFCIPRY